MKTHFLGQLLIACVMGLSSLKTMAANPTETTGDTITNTGTFTNVVLNSTYTFSGVDPYGSNQFSATLDQTTISNLNDLNPPVQFELAITSYTITDTGDDFVGSGVPTVTLSFQVQPNAQDAGNFPTITVTLKGNQTVNGNFQATSGDPMIFTLQSATPPTVDVTETSPGNAGSTDNEGTGTFLETVSNFEANGQMTLDPGITVGGQDFINHSGNQTFTVGGTLEVIYATPEPRSGWLALIVGMGLAGLIVVRRSAARRT